jgi:hypothetical protein
MVTRAKLVLTIINGSAYTPTPLTFSRHMYHPRRKAGCLLLLQSDDVTAKLYYIGTVNTFHHSYSQRILKYAFQRTFNFFYGT